MITFHCPSCGMRLQVPSEMAGVTGPCPQCSANIAAPAASPQTAEPQQQQAPVQPSYQQPQQQQQPAPAQQQQPPQQQHQQQQHPALSAARAGLAHQPSTSGQRGGLPRHIEPPKARRNWMRVVFPLAFLVVAAITILIVLQAVGIYEIYDISKFMPAEEEATPTTPATTTPGTTTLPAAPTGSQDTVPQSDSPAPDVDSPVTPDPPAAPATVPVSKQPSPKPVDGEFPELQLPPPAAGADDGSSVPGAVKPPVETPPTPPPAAETTPPPTAAAAPISTEQKSPPTAGSRAYQILTQFLEAKTLEERLPLMSKSHLTMEQLKTSCLAGPLGVVKSKRLAEMVPRTSDGMIQYLYYVSYEDKNEPQMRHRIVVQLVERPEVHSPRVHADAFIEHYEKKFRTYGLTPSKDVTTFHCIAEVRTSDLAKNIPKEIKKETIRLVIKTHPHGAALFDAFLNKNSPLMDKIGPGKEFPYIESRFCILSFRWNTKNPAKPYVELNDIVATGWEK